MNDNARNNLLDYIELSVSSAAALAQSKQFYESVFGWAYKDWGPDYSDTQSSGVSSGITVNAARLGRPLPVIFAIDLEQARDKAVKAGATLTKDIYPFPGGRRFEFTDPAGNELAVWSDK